MIWKKEGGGGGGRSFAADTAAAATCPIREALCGWSLASFSKARQPCSTEAASSMWPATSLITLSQKRACPIAVGGKGSVDVRAGLVQSHGYGYI